MSMIASYLNKSCLASESISSEEGREQDQQRYWQMRLTTHGRSGTTFEKEASRAAYQPITVTRRYHLQVDPPDSMKHLTESEDL